MDDTCNRSQKDITIPEVESFLGHVKSCIEGLNSAASQLPKVDEDGHSECPFAEELYKQKEEAQKKVVSCMKKLDEYQRWVKGQIKKCSDNLVVVSANADKLNNDVPKREFTEAEVRLAAIYKKLVRLKVKVKKGIKECQKSIQKAAQKNYPGHVENNELTDEDEMEQKEEEEMDNFLRKMLGKTPEE